MLYIQCYCSTATSLGYNMYVYIIMSLLFIILYYYIHTYIHTYMKYDKLPCLHVCTLYRNYHFNKFKE